MAVVVLVLLVALGGCGQTAGEGTGAAGVATTVEPEAGAGGLTGTVVARSDVEGEDDRARPGPVLALPGAVRADAESLLGGPLEQLGGALLPSADLERLDGVVVTAGADGRFALDVEPGEWLLCLTDDADGDVVVYGCGSATAPGDVLVESGEEGVVVTG